MVRQLGGPGQEAPVDADIVVGVPDSSLSAAAGYAEGVGLPYETGLIRNRYLGRTFIRPGQRRREQGVALKLNPIRGVVAGKRVVLVDDSLVRGTTGCRLVKLLRAAGAREVHLRIASPPVAFGCGLGMAAKDELIAARIGVSEIAQHVGADSIEFLSAQGMVDALGLPAEELCLGCFTGAIREEGRGMKLTYKESGVDVAAAELWWNPTKFGRRHQHPPCLERVGGLPDFQPAPGLCASGAAAHHDNRCA